LLKTAYFYNQGLFNPVLEAINEKRVAAGADALELDRDLCKAADGYASHLAKEPMRKYRKASPKDLNGAGECLTFYRVDPNAQSKSGQSCYQGVFADDLIERCVEKWFAEQEKFDLEDQEYYRNRGNNYTQMMWKASKKFGIGIGISENNIAHVCARFWPAGNNCGTFGHNVPNWRWPEINRGHGDRLRLNKDMNFIETAVSSVVKKNMGVEEKVQEVVHNAAFNAFYEEQSEASQEKLRKKKILSKLERTEDGGVKSTVESLVTDFKPKSSDAIQYEMTESGYKASFASEGKVIEGDERQLLADFIPKQMKKQAIKEPTEAEILQKRIKELEAQLAAQSAAGGEKA
jgi:hypothetical protein